MTTATPENLSQARCSCPYWSPFTCSCLLVKDALLIPLKSHVALHCFSSRFSFCSYFLQLTDGENQAKKTQIKPTNHRRSVRIPGCHSFRYSQLIDKHLNKTKESNTWTLDVSDHGLRFASKQSLVQDTAIRFLVEDDMSATKIEGVGRVVWSAPLKNTSLFQVGIAITWLFR